MEEKSGVEFVFAHIHLKCRDIDVSKTFYEKMVNARFLFEEEVRNARVVMLEIGGTYLHLSETEPGEVLESVKGPRQTVWTRYGLGHFGFRVKDLDSAIRELQQKGATFLGGIRNIREGVRVIYMRGPDDDLIEISERSPSFQSLFE
jgi:catechol 2,3-dioxygenase-like lactoylglutathione lyase family enzyme